MYKDKDKQREANRKAAKEYRDNRRKSIEGMANEGMTTAPKNVIPVIPDHPIPVIPKRGKIKSEGVTSQGVTVSGSGAPVTPKRGKDIKCLSTIDGSMPNSYYAKHKAVVTGKPGDADYNGICTPEWRAERGR